MIRARFYATGGDCRPIVWPYPHPYWWTGTRDSDDAAIVVAYADDEAQILAAWPDATEIDSEEREGYVFTSRFPQPDWFKEKK